jgi:hypothetical protein
VELGRQLSQIAANLQTKFVLAMLELLSNPQRRILAVLAKQQIGGAEVVPA